MRLSSMEHFAVCIRPPDDARGGCFTRLLFERKVRRSAPMRTEAVAGAVAREVALEGPTGA